jgi:protein-tyrosine-phosphatase
MRDRRGLLAFQILLVCTSNVCRSPTAALLLRRRLGDLGLTDRTELTTAGTTAAAGQPWCPLAARWVGDVEGRESLMAHHASRPLVPEIIRDADLILVAQSSHRAAVNQTSPAAAGYTFTLREAAVLGTAVAEEVTGRWSTGRRGSLASVRLELEPFPSDGLPESRLRWLVGEMHAARGVVRIPEERVRGARGWSRRKPSRRPGYDIPDPHIPQGPRHGRPLEMVRRAVDAWTTGVAAALDGVEGH